MKKTIYKITVTNWVKHNKHAKKFHKKTMIANNFCSDAKLQTVPLSYRWLFLSIILECSNSVGTDAEGTVYLSGTHLQHMLNSNVSYVKALDALQSLQLLSYEKNSALIEVKIKEKKIEENTNVKIEPAKRSAVDRVRLDFEAAYKIYPLKKGKFEGMKFLEKTIKTQAELDELKIAIERYKADCAGRGTESKYIKHFSTFVRNGWRDWLEPDVGKADNFESRQKTMTDILRERGELNDIV